jgi:c(7)-type cytochrome triheme protein
MSNPKRQDRFFNVANPIKYLWVLIALFIFPFQGFGEGPPALNVLPKNIYGFVDWTRAVREGIIKPKDSINGKREDVSFDVEIVFPSKRLFIPAVGFSHSSHNYWLECNSCHPEPFKPMRGANPMSMKEIWDGKFCGKCHGKVTFPPLIAPGRYPMDGTDESCRLCHKGR